MLPEDWMPVDPEQADVAVWGQNDPPQYTVDLPPSQRAGAEERIAKQVAKVNDPPVPEAPVDPTAAKAISDFLDEDA